MRTSLPAVFLPTGCDGPECKEVRQQLCDKACNGCDFCQLNFPASQASVLNGVADCLNVTTETVCTSDSEEEDLEACIAAIDASSTKCDYDVPDACTLPGAFEGG